MEPSRTSHKYQTTAGKTQSRPDLNEICIRKYDLDLVMAHAEPEPLGEKKLTLSNLVPAESIDTVRIGNE
jgi:hypothetical protein